jgi:hypothetical protein
MARLYAWARIKFAVLAISELHMLNIEIDNHQSCLNCRHGCKEAIPPTLATKFARNLPIDYLEVMSKVGREEITFKEGYEYATKNGHFDLLLYPHYLHFNDKTPCFLRYLEGVLNSIAHMARVRTPISDEEKLPEWFTKIVDEFEIPSHLGDDLPEQGFDHDPESMLSTSLKYWLRAAAAYDCGEHDICISYVTQSCFYLGMAYGPKFASEQARRGGEMRTDHLEALAHEAKRLLERLADELDGEKLSHASMVHDLIVPDLEVFHGKLIEKIRENRASPFRIMNMKNHLAEICKEGHGHYQIVALAFTAVCEQRRGPIPKVAQKRFDSFLQNRKTTR